MRRLQIFLDALTAQCKRHQLPAELIIVEWNPLPDRAPLAEALHWPADMFWCPARIIEVPASVHGRFAHGAALPLYQMIAKNVGIRRARGEFILATNIDIILNDDLMRFLSARRLDAKAMYRVDRYDSESDVPLNAPVEEQLEYCRTHLLRINRREGTFIVNSLGKAVLGMGLAPESRELPAVEPESAMPAVSAKEDEGDLSALDAARTESKPILSAEPESLPVGTITCGRDWFAPERFGGRTFRWVNNGAELIVGAPPAPATDILLDIEPGPGNRFRPLLLSVRDEQGATIAQAWIRQRQYFRFPVSADASATRSFRLITASGGERLASDPRILNFRVFDIRWSRPGFFGFLSNVRISSPIQWHLSALFRVLQTALARFFGIPDPLAYLDREPPQPCRPREPLPEPVPNPAPEGKAAEDPAPVRTSIKPVEPESGPDSTLLHLNGCGDFTLLHRDAWFDLRGYPEFDCFSMNIDSVLCLAAHNAGYHERFLPDPMRTYHVEHGTGWTPESQEALYERIREKGIPWLDASEVFGWADRMRYWKSPFLFNLDSWGMRDECFRETVIMGRGNPVSARGGDAI